MKSFSVVVIPQPVVVAVASDATTFTFTWKAAPGARYDIESAPAPGGPWTVLGEVTSASSTATTTVAMAGTTQFYRARLK